MLGIKRLDMFMLRQFLPLFAMTFLICTFIVLMQFMWLHLQDLVGKGVGAAVLGELFFYASLTMVPMALPLAVLLASLMTFGNIGESLELTAMKAGGISLFRVMRPLIVLMVFVAIGAFFFQNDVLPMAQPRMWTILKSIRQKTPELDITEGEFNYQLPNINIYVENKNRQTGVLHDVMIYDTRQGFERSRVIMADSATLEMSADNSRLYIDLFNGELFENLREGSGSRSVRDQLYRRELFDHKMITVAFDVNLEMMDNNDMASLYIGKNVSALRHSIDSINAGIDSVGAVYGRELATARLIGIDYDSIPAELRAPDAHAVKVFDSDSLRNSMTSSARRRYIQSARMSIEQKRMQYMARSYQMADQLKVLRRHGIELHRKFTLSLACLVFFFIGAPLGAIIRKGGLGTPLVISVFLFIFYYIIDNTGNRMAKDGSVYVWHGMWLSSAVLLPLGIFVTYKAVHDSAVFNLDSYLRIWRTLFGRSVRSLQVKEVVIEDFSAERATLMLDELNAACGSFLAAYPKVCGYGAYWGGGIASAAVTALSAELEHTVSYLSNCSSQLVLDKVSSLPLLENMRIMHPVPGLIANLCKWFAPVGLPVWLLSLPWQRRLLRRVAAIRTIIPEIQTVLNHGQYKA